MRKAVTLLFIILLSMFTTACSQASNEQVQRQEISQVGKHQLTDKQEQTWQEVTVKFYDLEGGFYGLTTKAGSNLLPMNLAKKYQLPGTILKVKGLLIKDMMTIQQWGQPFKITDTELVKLGKADESSNGAEY